MKIESNDRTLDQLLKAGYLRVPRFQRPYSWDRAEIDDFWNDTIAESDSDYFIGSIVLFTYGGAIYGIVDGQQRLTTITMLLCALRNALQRHKLPQLAQGLHALIERPDINNKNQFILQTETSYPYLQQAIQSFGKPEEELKTGEEERRLREAFEFLELTVRETLDSVVRDPALSKDAKQKQIEKRLIGIRDRILRLKVIVITLESEDDAYIIFETLNTRGKDLTVSDLVRTHITRLMPQSNKNVDRAKDRFNAVVRDFEASKAEVSINSFLHHYWLSKYEYTTEKKLYKELKKTIRVKDQAKAFLNSFENDAQIYRTIYEPETRRWNIEQRDIKASLAALMLFRVRQQLPFVLSVLREYEGDRLSLKNTRRALKAVENFHFVFTAVTSQRSSGGISFMYALHARQLDAAKSQNEKLTEINKLIEKLRTKLPPFDEFQANFREIMASEKFTKRKPLVAYILTRMSAEIGGVALDPGNVTIEHLANQSIAKGHSLTDEEVAEIGNLVLVPDKLNNKLGSKSFGEKIALLKKSHLWMDNSLMGSTWSAKEIRERTDTLANLAFHKVWTV